MKNMLSVVLPAYNEGLMIGKTCRVLREVLEGAGIPYELVLVNDGSSDNTWEEILKAGHKDPAVLGVRFRERSGSFCRNGAGIRRCGRCYGLRPPAPAGNTDRNVRTLETGV